MHKGSSAEVLACWGRSGYLGLDFGRAWGLEPWSFKVAGSVAFAKVGQ